MLSHQGGLAQSVFDLRQPEYISRRWPVAYLPWNGYAVYDKTLEQKRQNRLRYSSGPAAEGIEDDDQASACGDYA